MGIVCSYSRTVKDFQANMSQSASSRIGLMGLGVMGQNLALNIAEKGFDISGPDTRACHPCELASFLVIRCLLQCSTDLRNAWTMLSNAQLLKALFSAFMASKTWAHSCSQFQSHGTCAFSASFVAYARIYKHL